MHPLQPSARLSGESSAEIDRPFIVMREKSVLTEGSITDGASQASLRYSSILADARLLHRVQGRAVP